MSTKAKIEIDVEYDDANETTIAIEVDGELFVMKRDVVAPRRLGKALASAAAKANAASREGR